jgi:capsular polysaccharide transport system permease protein
MEVIAADPKVSQEFAESLISYAEETVDSLSLGLREGQMSGARESYEEAEENVTRAQQRVLDLQEQRGILSAEMEVTSLMGQISTLETELNAERLRLDELLENPRPNQTRVTVLRNNIARLEELVSDMRSEMTVGQEGDVSLARVSGELVIAEADLETRQLLLGQALQQLETARIEANRQVRYLSTSVSPNLPDQAAYPRALENTVLALLVFSGIYLMVSLTASILREQITG